jgi:hypothetical protein
MAYASLFFFASFVLVHSPISLSSCALFSSLALALSLSRFSEFLSRFSDFLSLALSLSLSLALLLSLSLSALVFFLALCDFMYALKFFLPSVSWDQDHFVVRSEVLCDVQAAWSVFWGLATISWNGIISLNILLALRSPFSETHGYVRYYHLYVWTLASVGLIVTAAGDLSAPAGDFTCWLRNGLDRLLFFLPLCMYFVISASALVVASVRTGEIMGDNEYVDFECGYGYECLSVSGSLCRSVSGSLCLDVCLFVMSVCL